MTTKNIKVNSNRPAIFYIQEKLGTGLTGAEIGVESGLNAVFILTLLEPKMLYLIDPWNDFLDIQSGKIIGEAQFLETKERLKEYNNYQIIRDISSNAVKQFQDNSLDFVYIDGDHCYEAVKTDLNIWYPKVRKGGILCGHDYHPDMPQVIIAVDEFCQQKGLTLNVDTLDWWVKKQTD